MDKLVYLTYPILLIMLLFGGKIYKKGQWNDEFLTLQQTKYIQGFVAVCIMLHHVGQETCASWQSYELRPGLELFVEIGYLLVSVFLFYSGYGLFKSYKEKENYLQGFIVKRIVPIIIAFYTSAWIYTIVRVLMHEQIDARQMIFYLIGIKMANPFTWYIIVMPFFYLIFYISFKFMKSDGMKITGVIVFVFAYTFMGTCINHNDYLMTGEWWYNSVHLFWIGILFARYERNIVANFKKYYVIYLVLSVVGAYVVFHLSELIRNTVSYYGEYNPMLSKAQIVLNRWICLGTQMLASILFVLAILIISMKLRIGNKFLGFMSGITLEFYLMHGLFLELFAREFCNCLKPLYMIKNVAALEIVVFILGTIAALLIKKLNGGVETLFGRRKK